MMTFTIVVIMSALASVAALTPITNANIKEAVALWKSDQSSCITTYGHISFWDTGSVTNMKELFINMKSFNEDLSKWDVGQVKNVKYVSMRARLSSAHTVRT